MVLQQLCGADGIAAADGAEIGGEWG